MSQVRNDVDAGIVVADVLGPVSIATNTNTETSAIDLAAYPGYRVMAVVASGTYTDGTYAIKFRESDDNSTYTDGTVFAGSAANITAADTAREFSFRPTKRYLKVRITSTSTTSGALLMAMVLLVPTGV